MAHHSLPNMFRKLVAVKLSPNFREAAKIISLPTPKVTGHDILVKNAFVGINASDVNYTAGRYLLGVPPPFDLGFEAMGTVVAVGEKVTRHKIGDAVMHQTGGAFADYNLLTSASFHIPVPKLAPEFLGLLVNGCTAKLGLEKVGELKPNETLLVTAAAGGTGQFAVQLAKQLGCHVIGTCSSASKVEFLKSLGCDRAINYKEESIHEVLKTEYPKGVDVVFESVGGTTFETCVKHLATRGRLIIIGYISGYSSEKGIPDTNLNKLPQHLLTKSASVRGYFMPAYTRDIPKALTELMADVSSKKLKSFYDDGSKEGAPLKGLESIFDAVEFLHSGKNVGKVLVAL